MSKHALNLEGLDTDQLKSIQKQIEEKLKKNIMERFAAAADPVLLAYEIARLNREEEIPFKNPKNKRQEVANAMFDLDIIAEVLRERKELDWEDDSTQKWGVWWRMKGGFRFFVTDCCWAISISLVGARLCQHTEEKIKFLAHTFTPLFKTANTK